MVAPHNDGNLVRSMVRVPLSGSDRSAGSSCLDLGRISTLAASVQVPNSFPPSLTVFGPRQNETSQNEPVTVTGTSNEKSKENLKIVASLRDQIVPVQTSVGQVFLLPLQSQGSNSQRVIDTTASVNQLVSTRDNLIQENNALRQRLALFQNIVNDRRRLNSGLKRI